MTDHENCYECGTDLDTYIERHSGWCRICALREFADDDKDDRDNEESYVLV